LKRCAAISGVRGAHFVYRASRNASDPAAFKATGVTLLFTGNTLLLTMYNRPRSGRMAVPSSAMTVRTNAYLRREVSNIQSAQQITTGLPTQYAANNDFLAPLAPCEAGRKQADG
jgi:hypothetical protein